MFFLIKTNLIFKKKFNQRYKQKKLFRFKQITVLFAHALLNKILLLIFVFLKWKSL